MTIKKLFFLHVAISKQNNYFPRFESFATELIQIRVLWDITQCRSVYRWQRFRTAYRLHLRGIPKMEASVSPEMSVRVQSARCLCRDVKISFQISKLNGSDSNPVTKLQHFEVSRNKGNGQENTLQLVEDMIFVAQTTLQYRGLQCVYNRCTRWPPSARIYSPTRFSAPVEWAVAYLTA